MDDGTNHRGREGRRNPDHYLSEWREYRGLSQIELGELVGASPSKISRVENGETELKPSFARRLAHVFRIPPLALITINPLGEGRQTADLLSLWATIAPGNRDAALKMLAALADKPKDLDKNG